MAGLRMALVGATGAVGGAFLDVLEHMKMPVETLDLLASRRSAGRRLRLGDQELEVQALDDYDFSACDVAFFSAGGSISDTFAPRATAAGCTVVDNSSRFRMDPDVPLIVPQINGSLLAELPQGSLIANPNCSTIQIVKILDPIQRLFGHRRSIVSTYQAASGAGSAAVRELMAHSRAEPVPSSSEHFPRSLAYNVVPVIDQLFDDGWTREEVKITRESRKILRIDDLQITATTVRVPVATGHSVAMYTETASPVDRARLLGELEGNPEVVVCGDDEIPTPRAIARPEMTYVGRIRVDPDNPSGLWTWIVADNLWVGAAFNGAQIAAALIERS
ncbi:MAG TPA: aspartate-semialdehyde dehydrogenase [Deltaproteobacteria bacterium]|nr:aspartate-semialdehyde dehydrogenase [Deltaproteobacteria bacterium]